ncbi:hypothetical protein B224_0071 [Aeromonas media WS]|nr:hypothetical protein B224_0071 [Aeromonas media WS]
MNVPPLNRYLLSESDLSKSESLFLIHLESNINNGVFIDVEGNVGYLFLYAYKLIKRWRKLGLYTLRKHLQYLSELYYMEDKFYKQCIKWSHDCLLAGRKFDDYLIATESKNPFNTKTHDANLRLNIKNHIHATISPLDILTMFSTRKSGLLIDHKTRYIDCVFSCWNDYEEKNGEFALPSNLEKDLFPVSLFNGVPFHSTPKLKIDSYPFYTSRELSKLSSEIARAAENKLREELDIPLIGEGWVSETILFKELENHFKETIVIQHGRPLWLGRQHFDIWFPDWNIAVEFHGEQHFRAIDFFGGEIAFQENQRRDRRKEQLAKQNGTTLFVVTKGYDINELIEKINYQREIEVSSLLNNIT